MFKKHLWAIIYTVVLIAFTVYISLDTFVIKRVYNENADQINLSMFEESTEQSVTQTETTVENQIENTTTETKSDENSYSDDNISINLTEYNEYNTHIYVADVKLSSAQYLKTALANNSYGKNITQKTSEMASDNNAILAINGDYYGTQNSGYVIRNGVLYRSEGSDNDILCVMTDGSLKITNSSEKTAEQLVSEGVWQAFSFGPALIKNGEVSVSEGEEVGKAMASNPRTAIGIIDDLHYIFVVSDGRTSDSQGLSLSQLAEFMKNLGATTAYNLDGGGSSTMYFNGKVINNPTTMGRSIKERSVSDIVYIG
ncbi:MAG: phosphodiester glycosidase family protein [Ruminococcus sp.]|nr:phosphodiester glycosidase family protein [Ruminococcus sp.]